MYNFCTLFDSNFLTRGLALYESLVNHCDSFHLYIFAFDDLSHDILKELSLESTTVISLGEFESLELLAVKPTRSRAEYCWTCSSNIIRYAIDRFGLDGCTYLDADLYFWNSPKPLFDEMGGCSILLTEHRYTPKYDQSKTSGKYCVQFVTFRNDKQGNKALNWWRDACNEWCYDRFEDGKFGDQKYLDDWTERFEGVHVLRHYGGGVAPWNVQQYDIVCEGEAPICRSKESGEEFPLVFYHFHPVRFYTNGLVDLGGYPISNSAKKYLYKPYVEYLENIASRLPTTEKTVLTHGAEKLKYTNPRNVLRHIKHIYINTVFKKASL